MNIDLLYIYFSYFISLISKKSIPLFFYTILSRCYIFVFLLTPLVSNYFVTILTSFDFIISLYHGPYYSLNNN